MLVQKLLNDVSLFLDGFELLLDERGDVLRRFGEVPTDMPLNLRFLLDKAAKPSVASSIQADFVVDDFRGASLMIYAIDENYEGGGFSGRWLVLGKPKVADSQRVTELLPTGVLKLDDEFKVTYANTLTEQLLGLSSSELQGTSWADALGESLLEKLKIYFYSKDPAKLAVPYRQIVSAMSPMGYHRTLSIQVAFNIDLAYSRVTYYVVLQDISAEFKANQKVQFMATHDSLTKLYNRDALIDKIIATNETESFSESALIYLDLDDFKAINDSHGHQVGDMVLKIVASRITSTIRGSDIAARIGGDEFVVFLRDVSDELDALRIAEKLREAVNQPVKLDDIRLNISSSIGMASGQVLADSEHTPQNDNIKVDGLLNSADNAMYESKRRHKGEVTVFDAAFKERLESAKAKHQLILGLISEDAAEIVFQPIFKGDEVFAVEALSRFHHDQLAEGIEGIIQLSKDLGYSLELFDYLFEKGLNCYKKLCDQLTGEIVPFLNINIDIEQISQSDFVDSVMLLINKYQISPSSVYLELTEKVMELDADLTTANVKRLQAEGFLFSMDDFGTGYSSINRLIQYDFDQVKIDQSFFIGLESSAKLQRALKAAVELGKALDLVVLAEGVETQAAWNASPQHKIDLVQGFLFSRAYPSDELVTLLNNRRSNIKLRLGENNNQ